MGPTRACRPEFTRRVNPESFTTQMSPLGVVGLLIENFYLNKTHFKKIHIVRKFLKEFNFNMWTYIKVFHLCWYIGHGYGSLSENGGEVSEGEHWISQ